MPVRLAGGGGGNSALSFLTRGVEMRVLVGGLNDGDAFPAPAGPLPGFSRFQSADAAQNLSVHVPLASSSAQVLTRTLDSRRVLQWFLAAGQNSCYVFRPGTTGVPWYLDFGHPTFPPQTAGLGGVIPTPAFGWATEIMAWCRKLNAGDASDCRMGFGMADNTTVSQSGTVPRIGLLGDGALGYRYGSVNCPDGLGGGPNAPSDIDANSVQPVDLGNPGAAWWHTRIKLIPALPGTTAQWVAFHNGAKIGPFTLPANFPRGHQGTSDDFSRIETLIWNFSGDVGGLHVPELCFWDLRVFLHDDYTTT